MDFPVSFVRHSFLAQHCLRLFLEHNKEYIKYEVLTKTCSTPLK